MDRKADYYKITKKLTFFWWVACALAIGMVVWQTRRTKSANLYAQAGELPGDRVHSEVQFPLSHNQFLAGLIVFAGRSAYLSYFEKQYTIGELSEALEKAIATAKHPNEPYLIEVYKLPGKGSGFDRQYKIRLRYRAGKKPE